MGTSVETRQRDASTQEPLRPSVKQFAHSSDSLIDFEVLMVANLNWYRRKDCIKPINILLQEYFYVIIIIGRYVMLIGLSFLL